MARMTKARLIEAGEELQKIMKYKGEDKFNPKEKDEEMKDWIENASTEIEPGDKLSDELIETLTDLGFWTEGTAPKEKEDSGDPNEDASEEDDNIEDILENSNLKELKSLVKNDERFSKLKSELKDFDDEDDLRDEMFDILDNLEDASKKEEKKEEKKKSSSKEKEPEPKEEKSKSKREKSSKKDEEEDLDEDDIKKGKDSKESKTKKRAAGFSRIDAVCEALKKGKSKTLDDLIEKADEIYEENGGKSNVKETRDDVKRAMKVLIHFEDDLKIKLPNS